MLSSTIPDMSRAQAVLSKIYILSFLAPATTKLFLAKTENFTTKQMPSAGDYSAGPDDNLSGIALCNANCHVKCTEVKSALAFAVTFAFGKTPFHCPKKSHNGLIVNPEEPTIPIPNIITSSQTTTAEHNCMRGPRNHKRNLRMQKRRKKLRKKEEPWGFWVAKLRSDKGKSFCCMRGPRSGHLEKSQGGCKK